MDKIDKNDNKLQIKIGDAFKEQSPEDVIDMDWQTAVPKPVQFNAIRMQVPFCVDEEYFNAGDVLVYADGKATGITKERFNDMFVFTPPLANIPEY